MTLIPFPETMTSPACPLRSSPTPGISTASRKRPRALRPGALRGQGQREQAAKAKATSNPQAWNEWFRQDFDALTKEHVDALHDRNLHRQHEHCPFLPGAWTQEAGEFPIMALPLGLPDEGRPVPRRFILSAQAGAVRRGTLNGVKFSAQAGLRLGPR
jgi:hypothetical protein